ncbi:hypothetical protein [Mucilaginibacter sp.]|uniref:hypothetical protein n=1 Tax=Mucilaginibacter sp. TaxID=1882438 RepID=UPI002ED4D79F
MGNSCRLKLEWIPSAYNTEIDRHKSPACLTSVKEVKQADIANGLYQRGGGFSRQQVYKKKWQP